MRILYILAHIDNNKNSSSSRSNNGSNQKQRKKRDSGVLIKLRKWIILFVLFLKKPLTKFIHCCIFRWLRNAFALSLWHDVFFFVCLFIHWNSSKNTQFQLKFHALNCHIQIIIEQTSRLNNFVFYLKYIKITDLHHIDEMLQIRL